MSPSFQKTIVHLRGLLKRSLHFLLPTGCLLAIAKGRGQRAEGRREKIDLSWFQDWARVKSRLGDCYNCFIMARSREVSCVYIQQARPGSSQNKLCLSKLRCESCSQGSSYLLNGFLSSI